MSEWQPIETAPKDGTVIDLWDGHYGHRVTNARWDYHYWLNGVPQREKTWGRDDRDGPFCGNPTHWMPIPAPPSSPNDRWRGMASERELEEALRERDGYHDVADEITDLVAQLLDQDFGEHSSANNPWVRCIEALEDALLAKGSTNDASVNSTTAPEGPSLTGND